MLQRHENLRGLTIKPELPTKKNLEEQFDYVQERMEEVDRVIWILDLDVAIAEAKRGEGLNQLGDRLRQMKETLEVSNGLLLVNTPCLEQWLLMHFEYSARYDRGCKDVISRLKKHLPDYQKTQKYFKNTGSDIYKKLRAHLPEARANATQLGGLDFYNLEQAKAEIYRLFEELAIDTDRPGNS